MEVGFIFILVLFAIINFGLTKLADLRLISYKSKTRYMRSSSFLLLIITFIVLKLCSLLISPYTTFSFLKYRVDILKEYNITIKSYDDVSIVFRYQVVSKTLFGDKVIDVTSDQFSKLKVGDTIKNNGERVSTDPITTTILKGEEIEIE